MAQLTDYRQSCGDVVLLGSIFSLTFSSNCGGSFAFAAPRDLTAKAFFFTWTIVAARFQTLGLDLPMRIVPETPAMIAGFPTNHLPVFKRSVNAAIRCASVGGSCPPANRPFYHCRFAGEQRRAEEATQILRLFLEVLRHKQPAERFWHGRCCSNYSNNYCTAG